MGFRTLSLQKRSNEVQKVLGYVKKESEVFGGLLEKAQKNIHNGLGQLDEVVGIRTRAIQRQLGNVETLPAVEAQIELPEIIVNTDNNPELKSSIKFIKKEMEKETIVKLNKSFEEYAYEQDGVDYWLARELQELLGYTEWRNFLNAIDKAKESCKTTGELVSDHFVEVNKMVKIGSGAEKQIDDIMVTRYACYLVAQNGDKRQITNKY